MLHSEFNMFLPLSTALYFQMMDERFSLDNDPDMTNHQENCAHTKVEVSLTLLIILCVLIQFSSSCLAFYPLNPNIKKH